MKTSKIDSGSISKLLKPEILQIKTGDVIFNEGQQNDFVYFIKSGVVKIMKSNWTIEIVQKSDFFGITSCLNDCKYYTYSSRATKRCIVYKIATNDFKRLLLTNQLFSKQLIKCLCKKTELVDLRIVRYVSLSPFERLLHELFLNIKIVNKQPISLINTIELAELTGVAKADIYCLLRELIDKNAINIDEKGEIQIINFKLLKSCIIN